MSPAGTASAAGLVRILDLCPQVLVELRYASRNNFFKACLYDGQEAWLLRESALKLKKAMELAAARQLRLKILDAYRPLAVQGLMWQILPDSNFVAPLSRGSIHNRGAAVDVCLTDRAGTELPMPSAFDDFSDRAAHSYQGGAAAALANRDCLRAIMEAAGFSAYEAEWWHYTDPEMRTKPLLDIPISQLA